MDKGEYWIAVINIIILRWGLTSTLTFPLFPAKSSSSKYKTSRAPLLAHSATASIKTKVSLLRSSLNLSTTFDKNKPKNSTPTKLKPKAKSHFIRRRHSLSTASSFLSRKSTCYTISKNTKIIKHPCSNRPNIIEVTPFIKLTIFPLTNLTKRN